MSIEDDLLAFISQDLLHGLSQGPLQPEDDLLGSGLVDSLGVMRIVAFVEKRYGIGVPPEDVRIENFLTVRQIADYLAARRAADAA